MKRTVTLNLLATLFFVVSVPHFLLAADGKPSTRINLQYAAINQVVADTTFPAQDQKTPEKKDAKTDEKNPVVKVIPSARRQPIPVPVKVKVQPVKIIKPKIIKPVVKPVIKILH